MALAAGGCEPSGDDVREARAVAEAYAQARGRNDFRAMCATLSDRLAEDYARGAGSCAAGARALVEPGGRIAEPFRIDVRESESSGDRIVAVFEYSRAGSPGTSAFQLELVREGGSWAVDADDANLPAG
ncbi:MAG TPA: hypothetical protein VF715_07825 [Thermoleophilaceae bacterium]